MYMCILYMCIYIYIYIYNFTLLGNKDGFEICTINHADGGKMRVDAAISYSDCLHEVYVMICMYVCIYIYI